MLMKLYTIFYPMIGHVLGKTVHEIILLPLVRPLFCVSAIQVHAFDEQEVV